MRYGLWLVCLLLLGANGRATAAEPALSFARAGEESKTLSLGRMKTSLPTVELAFHDPEYGKPKRYRGFALAGVLDLAFGPGWQGHDYTEMIFTALDGYAAVGTLDKLGEAGGYLVFEDRDYPDWEPVGRNRANPGPFYLVWTGASQTTAQAYPWPWQLAKIELVKFSSRYPEVYPAGAARDSAAWAGFVTFKDRCMRCHAMNQQGGKVGPDLNAPQSVTEYRSPMMLKAFIRQPSQFRYTHMPDHADLGERQLDELLAYFRHMAKPRVSGDGQKK